MAKYKKKDKDDGSLVGKLITILFLLILAGGIYFLVNLFKSVEINEVNISGDWKLAGSPTVFYTFSADGNASSYEQFTAGEVRNQCKYTYSLDTNDNGVVVMTLKDLKTKETKEIKLMKVSHAEISIIQNGSEFDNLTRVNIF